MILNVKLCFIYGWGSLRNVKIYADDKLLFKVLAQGNYILEIPENTNKLSFKLGLICPYETTEIISTENRINNKVYVGLYWKHRGMLRAVFDSLKSDYLQSIKLNSEEYAVFEKDIYQQEFIMLKDNKTSLISLLVSLVILVFSIVQQENDLASLAFMIGLSSSITSLVYFKDLRVEKSTYKTRMLSTLASFVLAVLFLENCYGFLHFIILIFTGLLYFIYRDNIKNVSENRIIQ